MRLITGIFLWTTVFVINAAPAPQLLAGLLGGQRPLLGGAAPNQPRPLLGGAAPKQPGPILGALINKPANRGPLFGGGAAPNQPRPILGAIKNTPTNQGTGVAIGQATGGTLANAQGQSATIPIGPFGGRVTLAQSTSLAAGIPGLGGKPGGGATAGGVGGGNVGPGGTNISALSKADAQEGVAFGQAVGVGIDLPLLGVHQAFGQGGGIAIGK